MPKYQVAKREKGALWFLTLTGERKRDRRAVVSSDRCVFFSDFTVSSVNSAVFHSNMTQVSMLEDVPEKLADVQAIRDSNDMYEEHKKHKLLGNKKHKLLGNKKHKILGIKKVNQSDVKLESDHHQKLRSHSHEKLGSNSHEKSGSHIHEKDENTFDLVHSGVNKCLDEWSAKKKARSHGATSKAGHRNVRGSQVQDGTSILMRAVSWHGVYSDIEFVQ